MFPPKSARSSIAPQMNSAAAASAAGGGGAEAHGMATLKELCAADKEKIGKMLQSVSTLNSENAALKESLKAAQVKHQEELAAQKHRGDQSMLDEADTRGKLSQALSLLAQYEERIQIVTRQMHAQESLLSETQFRLQQTSAELESCRAQLSSALLRPQVRSDMVQSQHNIISAGSQTDRWLEPNTTVLPMPQQPPLPLPQSPPRSGHGSQHASPAKSAVADSVLLGSVRNSFASHASEAGQPAAPPAPALLSLKHLNSLVSRLASSGIRPQASTSATGSGATAESINADKWMRSSSSPWNSTSAQSVDGSTAATHQHHHPAQAAAAASPSRAIAASSYAVSRASFDPRRSSPANSTHSLDGYDVTLVDLVESIEHNRPKSSRLPASSVRSSVRSSSTSVTCQPCACLALLFDLFCCRQSRVPFTRFKTPN